jgi:hypothetical protein
MNLFTSLPFEIQDYIFEFDGRYKTAMKKTLTLVEEWGKTAIHGKHSWTSESPFLLEAERRAEMYSRHLGDDDVIRLRHAVIDTTVGRERGFHNLFKDVLGAYSIMAKPRKILVDGEEYKSTKHYKYVGTHSCITQSELKNAIGTTTRESRFYLLDPKVRGKLRRLPYSVFLEHGLSLNGKRVKKVLKTKPKPAFVFNPATDIEADIDGRDYCIRNGTDIINIVSGLIVGTVDGDEAVWLGDAR